MVCILHSFYNIKFKTTITNMQIKKQQQKHGVES